MSEQEQNNQEKQIQSHYKVHKGSFLTLKASNLIDPVDGDAYSAQQSNIMKAQGLLMTFSVLWARLLETGNFKLFTKNRWAYYGGFIGIPSIFHAIYVSYEINAFTNKMDVKYSKDYYEKYLSKLQQQHAENNN